MNLRLPKIRGLLYRLSQYRVPDFIKDNWLKIVIIVFALFIILKKDISFNFDLRAAGGQVHSKQGYETVNAAYRPLADNIKNTSSDFPKKEKTTHSQKMEMSLPTFSVDHSKLVPQKEIVPSVEKKTPKSKKKAKDNRANHFFNIAFILNPNYAIKKGIDKKVVEEKNGNCYRYVKRYGDIAISEMKKYGIPASITLAQGLLESDAGGSRLSRANNNHFGIKCFSKKCGKHHCSNFTDDTHKDFFRKYKNVWQSYRAHSLFLQGKRYAHLQKLGTKDYKGWAKGLRKAGYATDKKYAEKLIKIIEVMKLNEYDV